MILILLQLMQEIGRGVNRHWYHNSIRFDITMRCILTFQYYCTCLHFCQWIQAVRYM